MEIQKLNEHNPWWTTKKIDDTLTCKERKEYDLLLKSVEIPEITIITGVRRSGKSTLMYQMIAKLLDKGINPDQILFVNLEDPKLSPDNIENIHDTYRNEINPDKKAYIFFDEIHRKNGWESWIRRQYDLKKYCKFIISGSSSYLLKREYSTLLTGRNLTFEVSPLSFKEFLEFKGVMLKHENVKKNLVLEKDKHQIIKSLTEYLQNGGFPNIFFKEKEFKTRMLVQYFDDILYKDIVDRYILNGQKARDLALYLMTNFTSLISLRNLRNTLGLSYESITNYISYYKEAFLFFTLEHFSYSLKEQKTNASKIYCIDNGLRNAVSFKFSKDEGKLVENCVFLELKRKQQNMYYWSNNNSEVDFVIKNSDNTLTIINVTYTDEVG
ncbi:MAG: ATP-binding protein, partial [Nanoarchaeota archaeon]|nr:ATP-binding protein [Nanoarchaeota archaeon]